ncbi:AEC family transporter [Novosphingobium sp. BL-8H]|uniref:AEC family transporter n=1 Tax=Novosphingobium sp. BL-8H TaxID=3127640 RepID=UPI0037564FFA
MLTILSALLPVFGLIALGFVAGRTGYLGEGADGVLSHFVAQVTLPVLTFRAIATMTPEDLGVPAMATVAIAGPALVWISAFLFERWRGEQAGMANVVAMGASFGNGAFIGLPVSLALLGPASLGPCAVAMALYTMVVFSWCVFVGVLAQGGQHSVAQACGAVLRQLCRSPLVIGCVLGIGFALGRLPLTPPVDRLLETLGNATGPCALVAIGMVVAKPLEGRAGRGLGIAVIGKLLVLPGITLCLLAVLPPLPPVWAATAIIMAGASSATSTFILAAQTGPRERQLGAAAVVLSTIGAAFTLPGVLLAIEALGIARFTVPL